MPRPMTSVALPFRKAARRAYQQDSHRRHTIQSEQTNRTVTTDQQDSHSRTTTADQRDSHSRPTGQPQQTNRKATADQQDSQTDNRESHIRPVAQQQQDNGGRSDSPELATLCHPLLLSSLPENLPDTDSVDLLLTLAENCLHDLTVLTPAFSSFKCGVLHRVIPPHPHPPHNEVHYKAIEVRVCLRVLLSEGLCSKQAYSDRCVRREWKGLTREGGEEGGINAFVYDWWT